MANNLRQLHI